MTTQMNAENATALRRPFPPESVGKLPKGGVMLDYVGHAAVTDRLLTVDPEWTWDFLAYTPDGLPVTKDSEGNLWIKLTICGMTRIAVGDGKSAKERIGDAIRNGAMRFGVALDLWAKENLVEFEQAASGRSSREQVASALDRPLSPPEPEQDAAPFAKAISEAQRKKLHALANDLGLDRTQKLAGCTSVVGREVGSTNDLTADEAKRVIDRMEARLSQPAGATA